MASQENVTIEITGIGPVFFERSRRAKRLRITVKPFKGVRVAVPEDCSIERAQRFLTDKREWLKKAVRDVKEYEREQGRRPDRSDIFDEAETRSLEMELKGVGKILFVRNDRAKRMKISVRPFEVIRVTVPAGVTFSQARDFVRQKQTWLLDALEKNKIEEQRHGKPKPASPDVDPTVARIILRTRLKMLADKFGFTYNKVRVKNQKTLWGSCSTDNNINLNQNLIALPRELLDYVLLHELVHTRIKDHSKKFWTELNKYVGDAKALDKKLKDHKF